MTRRRSPVCRHGRTRAGRDSRKDAGVRSGEVVLADADTAVLVGSGVRGGVVGPVGPVTLVELLAARELDLGRAAVVCGGAVPAYQGVRVICDESGGTRSDRGRCGVLVMWWPWRWSGRWSQWWQCGVYGEVGGGVLPIDRSCRRIEIAFMVADSAVSVELSPLRRCVVVCLITGG